IRRTMTHFMNCLMLALLFIQHPREVPAQAKTESLLTLIDVDPPILRADQNGTAAATLTIRVDEPPKEVGPPKGVLTVTDFHHQRLDKTEYPLFTAATLTAIKPEESKFIAGEEPYPKGLMTVRLTVSNLWEAGLSVATLKYGDTTIPIA